MLQKQSLAVNFLKGLDTKSDPYQLALDNFLTLVNSVFTKSGALTKRNGYTKLTSLPDDQQTTLTTLNDNLIATGSDLYALSRTTGEWLDQGTIQPINLNVKSVVRSSTSQVSPDAAITPSGLACVVYMDNGASYYQIVDNITGLPIQKQTLIPNLGINPRAFLLGVYFIITFVASIAGTPTLQFLAIPTADPTFTPTAGNINANVDTVNAGYDAYSINNQLFIAWGSGGSSVKIAYLTNSLVVSPVTNLAGVSARLMSVTADASSNTLWVSYWDGVSMNGFTAAFDYILTPLLAPTQFLTATNISELTSLADNKVNSLFYENVNSYSYTGGGRTDYISTVNVTFAGSVGLTTIVVRSLGLASKPFKAPNGSIYMLSTYGCTTQAPTVQNSQQPSYFLIDSLGNVYMRLAYSNGGGYAASQVLPTISLVDDNYYVPYLIADLLVSTNKGTNIATGTPTTSLYAQTGVNMAEFNLNLSNQLSSEIAGALHLTGGQLWEYDGVKPVEFDFQVWPENVAGTTSTTGGTITAGTYFYQFLYEWTDNAGNIHRSAPSIPVKLVTTGTTSSNTLHVPTYRPTYKKGSNPVRIVGYRFSVAQQIYYQFTSITSPVINNTTVDAVTIIDTLPDSAILGNPIIYTNGGVIEDIAPPACIASCLFQDRLFLVDAEDRNLIWFSKQVIENVPVEMSDLLTIFVAPTIGAQGSTGFITALSAMDDKLIIFKRDAIYYITGQGPDNTGANNTFSDPIFITATVGCDEPNSIVLMPSGIMFQSDKGIWLLGRDLSTTYIGAPVEGFNSDVALSSTAIPGTNQVRFVLDTSETLMYDYYFNQWATHTNIKAISATLYQGKHTYLNSLGQIYQETPGMYLDGAEPVLMSLTSAWINLAGVQGFERFYFANLLGTYYSPFILDVGFAYNYNSSLEASIPVTPDNYVPNWGGEAVWGSGGPWGGPGNVFTARVFPRKQKCQSFQISIQERYDASLGQAAGQGLTLSGMNIVAGIKRGFRTQSAKKSFG